MSQIEWSLVEQAIDDLYSSNDPVRHRQAQNWLVALQNSPHGLILGEGLLAAQVKPPTPTLSYHLNHYFIKMFIDIGGYRNLKQSTLVSKRCRIVCQQNGITSSITNNIIRH